MKYPLMLIVSIAFLATGEALRCWECSTSLNSECGDPFDKSAGAKETTFHFPCYCTKEVLAFSDATYTTRSCTPLNSFEKSNLSRARSTAIVSYSVHFCNTDLCNGASSITAALSTSIALAMLLIFANWN